MAELQLECARGLELKGLRTAGLVDENHIHLILMKSTQSLVSHGRLQRLVAGMPHTWSSE